MKLWIKARDSWRKLKVFEQIFLIFTAIVTTIVITLFVKVTFLDDPRLGTGSVGIKAYSYSGNIDKFISHVRNFSDKNSSIIYKMADTTGTPETGLRFYLDINLKNKENYIQYTIGCENEYRKDLSMRTYIFMVTAIDSASKTGGYRKEAKGILPLVNYFDINFIKPLMSDQGIQISSP